MESGLEDIKKLSVICVGMEQNVVLVKNVPKGKKIDEEKKGTQGRALWHTCSWIVRSWRKLHTKTSQPIPA